MQQIRTERIGQEVILLPESERVIVDLSTLDRLTPATAFVAPQKRAGGLTVKKRADGLIEIESRRDTVRIAANAVCEHSEVEAETKEVKNRDGPGLTWLAVFLVLGGVIVMIRKV
ncbi:MAG: hypothetical protein ACRC9Q_10785 [Bacteroidales bacterium]